MTDHFKVLGLAPAPWVDEAALKDHFQKSSAHLHPDVAGGDAEMFRALNEAYQVVRDPSQRLRHLLELRAPDLLGKKETLPDDLVQFFLRAGAALQKLAKFSEREKETASPLTKALLAPEKIALTEDLQAIAGELRQMHAHAIEELAGLAGAWETPQHLARLAALQQRLAFAAKWTRALHEKLFALEI